MAVFFMTAVLVISGVFSFYDKHLSFFDIAKVWQIFWMTKYFTNYLSKNNKKLAFSFVFAYQLAVISCIYIIIYKWHTLYIWSEVGLCVDVCRQVCLSGVVKCRQKARAAHQENAVRESRVCGCGNTVLLCQVCGCARRATYGKGALWQIACAS